MAQRVKPKQAQSTTFQQDQDVAITQATSLKTVKTLLDTGLGCVAYLRSLFPEEAFIDAKIEAPRLPISDENPPSSSQLEELKKGPSTTRVKKLTRGFSNEADKLLDLIEIGAADALEKGYLQQLVLGIYLDPEDSSNVVECYTFTFTYNSDEDGKKHPEMVIRNQLNGMVLSNTARKATFTQKGVKEGTVQRQVQVLIKNLITCTQGLNELPRRRFVSVRVYYTEETPTDYEPPLFRPIKSEDTSFKLATSQVEDRPDTIKMGAVETGYHGVTLHVVSVVPLLEVKYDEHVPLTECLARNQIDAASRKVLWDATKLVSVPDASEVAPLAIRDDKGVLHSVEEVVEGEGETFKELKKQVGLEEEPEMQEDVVVASPKVDISRRAGLTDNEILRKAVSGRSQSSESLVGTQLVPVVSRHESYRPPAPPSPPHAQSQAKVHPEAQSPVEQRRFSKSRPDDQPQEESIIPGLETLHEEDETAFRSSNHPALLQRASSPLLPEHPSQRKATPRVQTVVPRKKGSLAFGQWAEANGRKVELCECGVPPTSGHSIECSSCQVWKHVVCYGFHSDKDNRIPEGDWFCYPCRVVCSVDEGLLHPEREAEIANALDSLGSLALFRRAIALIWEVKTLTAKSFQLSLGVDTSTSGQISRRLRSENFIQEVPKLRGPKGSQLIANTTPEQRRKKDDVYFNPGRGAEIGLISVLDSSDADAEGEDDPSVAGSHQIKSPSSPIQVPSTSQVPPSTNKRALRFEIPPSPPEHDPIVTSDDERDDSLQTRQAAAQALQRISTPSRIPFSPPSSTLASTCHADRDSASKKTKGKGKATGQPTRAVVLSPPSHTPPAVQEEHQEATMSDPEPDTLDDSYVPGGSSLKRRSYDEEEDINMEVQEERLTNKRKRGSEGDEIEV